MPWAALRLIQGQRLGRSGLPAEAMRGGEITESHVEAGSEEWEGI